MKSVKVIFYFLKSFVILLLFYCLILSNTCQAQIDTVFWFAVPEVTSRHADEPIFLRISTLDNPSEVTVSIPASGITIANNVTIAANSSYDMDLTSYKNDLETSEANINQIINKGLLIQATEFVTVYYEVLGSVEIGTPTERIINTDIFSLKGSNALGKEFYVPFQNLHDNKQIETSSNPHTSIMGRSTIDIVATEDNTQITIYPTEEYRVGAGSSSAVITVTLNRGQTYSVEAFGYQGSKHMSGTRITSTKPIAVTMKDDSIINSLENKDGYDLAGDQIIPVIRTGKEYIVYQGYAFITSTQDNTDIFVGGVLTTTINEGETYSIDLRSQPSAVYITSSARVYLHHLFYLDDEMASAVMPPLQCTGSDYVSVNRSSFNFGEIFYLVLTVEAGSEGDFIVRNSLNPTGSTSIIQASDFSPVPGTANWLYAFLSFNDLSEIPLGSTVVENTSGVFHLGTVNGKPIMPAESDWRNRNATGYRYGYFTDFGYLNVNVSIPDQCIIQGDSVLIYPGDFQSYVWSNSSTDTAIYIKQSGEYSVVVENGDGCVGYGDFSVEISERPVFTLGEDIFVCDGDPIRLEPLQNNFSEMDGVTFEWNTGHTSSSLEASAAGEYILKVTNKCGHKNDTIIITRVSVEPKNLFTPNIDGKNETFVLEGLDQIGDWKLEVFNRWGEQVYSSDSYDNSWDGLNVQEGVYYYHFIDQSGQCPEYKGWVQIVK